MRNIVCLCAGDQPDNIEQAKAYQSFLKKIAYSLGLSEKEASTLAEETCASVGRHFADVNEGLTMRLCLVKHLIRNSIFRISTGVFGPAENAIPIYAEAGCSIPFPVRKLPISLRTVYILVRWIGFNETEVSQLLNITPQQVKARLAKGTMSL